MDSDQLVNWLNLHLERINHKEFQNCIKINRVDVKPLIDQPVVVVSDINRVTITMALKNGEIKQLKAVAKFEPTVEAFSHMVKEFGLIDTETMMYQKLLKSMEELIVSSENEKDTLWPECYICFDKKFVLEDLNVSGYRIVPPHDLLDVAHAKLALKSIGRYHGASLVLKERGIIETNKLPVNLLAKNLIFMNNLYMGAIHGLANYVGTKWGSEGMEVAERLRKCVENVGEKLQDLVTSNHGKCDVMCHGDFTIRNMLFHYCQDDVTPDKVKFVDFQGTSWSNLGFDVVNFLCSSMFPQIREQSLDVLLGTYSESLANTCRENDYQGYIPTLKDVYQVYDDMGYLQLITSTCSIPALVAAKSNLKVNDLMGDNNCSEGTNKDTFLPSYYGNPLVRDAVEFELRRCLKKNII